MKLITSKDQTKVYAARCHKSDPNITGGIRWLLNHLFPFLTRPNQHLRRQGKAWKGHMVPLTGGQNKRYLAVPDSWSEALCAGEASSEGFF